MTELQRDVLAMLANEPREWHAPKSIAAACQIRPKWAYGVAEYLVRRKFAESANTVDSEIKSYRITGAGIMELASESLIDDGYGGER